LPATAVLECTIDGSRGPRPELTSSRWHALWTRSHCERIVHDQLAARGFQPFLPTIKAWSRRAGVRHLISVPMFPSYLFLRHSMDKASYLEILKSRGLVAVLGERWDRLAVVPETEIEAIRRVLETSSPVVPYPYLSVGQRVRIAAGPLLGVEGILVRSKPRKGLLVLSVELLRRSIAVEVDCTQVAAA
jgi:transcription termination/antitermination protein NusG